ncbi:hypothetical protein NBRC111894_3856 [Sporolactobacillus inulinus]|uniref:Uncharacterized protein n=1 Tax=Sporolactobacillus inulinus TaxID=2078 RepID=A0A4Y1ZGJ1_9BACL|nr:hypothetical protein NBRC111894_3856 [Sporolactobacillus inulinus]
MSAFDLFLQLIHCLISVLLFVIKRKDTAVIRKRIIFV